MHVMGIRTEYSLHPVCLSGLYIVHNLVSTGLHCAPSTCVCTTSLPCAPWCIGGPMSVRRSLLTRAQTQNIVIWWLTTYIRCFRCFQSRCLSGFVRAMLCITSTVQDYVLHSQPALCTMVHHFFTI